MKTNNPSQVILEVANNGKLSGAVLRADRQLWDLCMRGINSPYVSGQLREIADRVSAIAIAAGVTAINELCVFA